MAADSKGHRSSNNAANDQQSGQVHRSERIRLGRRGPGSGVDTNYRGKQKVLGSKTYQDGPCLWV